MLLPSLILSLLALSTSVRASWPHVFRSSPANETRLAPSIQLVLDRLAASPASSSALWIYSKGDKTYPVNIVSERDLLLAGKPAPKTDKMREVRDAGLYDSTDEPSLGIFIAWLLHVPHLSWHPKFPMEEQNDLLRRMKQEGGDPHEVDSVDLFGQLHDQLGLSFPKILELKRQGLGEVQKPGREIEREILKETIASRKEFDRKKDCVRRHAYTDCWYLVEPLGPNPTDEERGMDALARFVINSDISGLWKPLEEAGVLDQQEDGSYTEEQMQQMLPVFKVIAEVSGMLEDVDTLDETGEN